MSDLVTKIFIKQDIVRRMTKIHLIMYYKKALKRGISAPQC